MMEYNKCSIKLRKRILPFGVSRRLALSFSTFHSLNAFLAKGGYYTLDNLETLPLKSRINVIGYVTGLTEIKKSVGG